MGGVVNYQYLKDKCNKKLKKTEKCRVHIIVQLSKCSIAAGADMVLKEIQKTIKEEMIEEAIVEVTGCMGLCHAEPIVTVYSKVTGEVTYTLVTPKMARVITIAHGIYGKTVDPWAVNNN